MRKWFTNSHSHIFTVRHAPDFFLKTMIKNTVVAEMVLRLLERPTTRRVIKFLQLHVLIGAFLRKKKDLFKRYIEFVEIGTSINQQEIFDQMAATYAKFPDYRIVVLTQNLDFLDIEQPSVHIRLRTQVEQVRILKRNPLYANRLFPFLGVDSRHAGIDLMTDWVTKYIHPDNGFYGIKIYPAAGFFPFDPRLDAIWAWAEQNQIPVMTHCTRGGSWYLGRFNALMSHSGISVGYLEEDSEIKLPTETDAQHASYKALVAKMVDRFKKLVADTSVHGNNRVWCNIFGHPDSYRPVLRKYPKLKLCLAHCGGANEINRFGTRDDGGYPKYLRDNWYEMVLTMMAQFENVYTDISYTLSNKKALGTLVDKFSETDLKDAAGRPLKEKVLYGTDYFLTQVEDLGDESMLENLFLDSFHAEMVKLLAYENPKRYLQSTIFP